MKHEPSWLEWSKNVAALAVDRLIDEGIIKKDQFQIAMDLVEEEITVRLSLGDFPKQE